VEFFWVQFLFVFIYGRVILAMEGKRVVPMEIACMDTEDEY
jgi:hypothetical protein